MGQDVVGQNFVGQDVAGAKSLGQVVMGQKVLGQEVGHLEIRRVTAGCRYFSDKLGVIRAVRETKITLSGKLLVRQ